MKRLARRLFTLCSASSLLLCVSVVALWILSYFTSVGFTWSDGVRVPTAGYQVAWRKVLIAERGRAYLMMDRSTGAFGAFAGWLPLDRASRGQSLLTPRPESLWRRLLGFNYETRMGYPAIASVAIGPPVELTRIWSAPLWAVAVGTGLLPGYVLGSRRTRRNRRRHGLCPSCGYDLRASPDRCPECGTVPEVIT